MRSLFGPGIGKDLPHKGWQFGRRMEDVNEPTPESTEAEVVDAPSLEEQLRATEEKLARARADYVNLEKRVARDAALERERVKARVLEGFLPVFEYGKMAQVEAEKSPGPLAQGVDMVVREFERMLQNEGIIAFGTVGDKFDGSIHEAVSSEDGPEGEIVRVVTQGYRLGDRVLRYAKVVVGQ